MTRSLSLYINMAAEMSTAVMRYVPKRKTVLPGGSVV